MVTDDDCTILCGARSVEEESAAIASGHSKLTDPYSSKHVVGPQRPLALAVDVAPFPVIWPDPLVHRSREEYARVVGRFYLFAGVVKTKARALGIKVRWGGAWNGELNPLGAFQDLPHWELV